MTNNIFTLEQINDTLDNAGINATINSYDETLLVDDAVKATINLEFGGKLIRLIITDDYSDDGYEDDRGSFNNVHDIVHEIATY